MVMRILKVYTYPGWGYHFEIFVSVDYNQESSAKTRQPKGCNILKFGWTSTPEKQFMAKHPCSSNFRWFFLFSNTSMQRPTTWVQLHFVIFTSFTKHALDSCLNVSIFLLAIIYWLWATTPYHVILWGDLWMLSQKRFIVWVL